MCPHCQGIRFLTKHSKIGGHQPPYEYLCRFCHDKEHGITHYKTKYSKKYQRGTKRQHKKRLKNDK